MSARNTFEKVLSRVDRTDSCWLWTGCKKSSGYGTVRYEGRTRSVHRLIYEKIVGPIPDGAELDHLCRVRHCVNPDHLDPVSHRENGLRGEKGFMLTGLCRKGLHGPESWGTHPAGSRLCDECARLRRAEKHRLINEARKVLGLRHAEYRARYGSRIGDAKRILEGVNR